jgi:hypothetical protein
VDEEEGEPEVKVPDEKQKEKLLSAYKTHKGAPCLFVHPNRKVKSGKFDCRVESLSVLLDYRWGIKLFFYEILKLRVPGFDRIRTLVSGEARFGLEENF